MVPANKSCAYTYSTPPLWSPILINIELFDKYSRMVFSYNILYVQEILVLISSIPIHKSITFSVNVKNNIIFFNQ